MEWSTIIYTHIIFILMWVLYISYALADEKNRCGCPCWVFGAFMLIIMSYPIFVLGLVIYHYL